MKLTTKTLIAGLMATGISTAAFAGTDVGVGAAAGASAAADSGVSATAGADVTGAASTSKSMDKANKVEKKTTELAKENYGQLISELRSNSSTSADVEAEITDFNANSELQTVTVTELKGNASENAAALDGALEAQEESVADMRAAIEANAELKAQVEAEGFTPEQVVAVRTNGMGGLTLVVDDRG